MKGAGGYFLLTVVMEMMKYVKSTKVQNPQRILLHVSSLVNYANARAWKLAMPRVVAVTRGAVSSRSNKG